MASAKVYKKFNYVYLFIFLVIIFFLFILWHKFSSVSYNEQELNEAIVQGSSMEPIINPGDIIKYTKNFTTLEREDIVLYNFSGSNNLILKRVKAIPNDTFRYGDNIIYINGVELRNSMGELYKINSKMLDLYANSYPILPEDTYLILGESPDGTLDSSQFGLVHKSDIIGLFVE